MTDRPSAASAVVWADDHSSYVTDPYAKRRHVLAARLRRHWPAIAAVIWLAMVAGVVLAGPVAMALGARP